MTAPRYRILVIDDNEADAGLVERHLARVSAFSAEVIKAASHEQGLDLLDKQGADCVVLDYRLGPCCGLDTLRAIRARGDDTAVVFVTGFGTEMIAVEALKCGAQDYLVKSVLAPEVLQRAIQNAVEKVALGRQLCEKQRELEDFVSVVAHDLQQPLCAVKGNIELIRDFYATSLDGQALEFVDAAIRTSARMSEMIDALLGYARAGRNSAPREAVKLNEVLEGVRHDLAELVNRSGARLEIGPLPTVSGDPVTLSQLFQNLLANAIKFRGRQPPEIAVGGKTQAGWVTLWVRDNGIGIPADALEMVFAPFRRLAQTKDRAGSGIGLATCKKIAVQHHGRIWVESELGSGSTFFVTLPVSRPRALTDGSEARGRVLLADADSETRRSLMQRLAERGMSVDSAASFEQAAGLLENGRFDALLVDLALPDGDGMDLIRCVRRRAPWMAVLAVTAGVDRCGPGPLLAEALREGADHALPKPLDAARAAAVLRGMIEESTSSMPAA